MDPSSTSIGAPRAVSRADSRETQPAPAVTRGHGTLERFLAARRCSVADRLIPDSLRDGRLVDVGCGSYPFFLSRVRFAEKIGIERPLADGAPRASAPGVTVLAHDLETEDALPLATASAHVVTMLAVFEHITPTRLLVLLREIHRVLVRGGMYVLTTPPVWTTPILRGMARARLVSAEEIEEHKVQYTARQVLELLGRSGFDRRRIQWGYFEMGLNLWATATK
jgi:SAM-dependent methyltransferase